MKKLPEIPSDANKYTRGSLLVLAGSRRYFGAGVLATLAAEKTGAGYVKLATPQGAVFAAKMHLLCSPVIEAAEDNIYGGFAASALPDILQEATHVDALCVGPGLTVQENTSLFLSKILQHAAGENIPLLLDADALTILAAKPQLADARRAELLATQDMPEQTISPLILTPHEGELARLHNAFFLAPRFQNEEPWPQTKLRVSVSEAAEALSEELGAIVVAKGPTTFIADGVSLIESSKASPALAKAGTGDVLSGIISSLLAQGIAALDAAILGVEIHGKAGLLAEKKLGRRSVTALDVIEALPQAVKSFEV